MKKAPLSDEAAFRYQSIHWGPSTTLLLIGGISALLSLNGFPVGQMGRGILFLTAGIAIALLGIIGDHVKMKAQRKSVEAENERDYRQSLALKTFFDRFTATPLNSIPVPSDTDATPDRGWKVFRVEHFLRGSARSTMAGRVDLEEFLFVLPPLAFGSGQGHVRGTMRGNITPDLFDDSCLLFLTSGQATLRVLLPSAQTTRELLARTLEQWLSLIPYPTHCAAVLHRFASENHEPLFAGLEYFPVIDELDAACAQPLEQRPSVVVHGELLQPGVLLATSLKVGDRPATVFPSGVFNTVIGEFKKALSIPAPAPMSALR